MGNIKKIFENLRLETVEAEKGQPIEMLRMAKKAYPDDVTMIAMIMFEYGKQCGKRNERIKQYRKNLIKRFPDMKNEIKKSSDEVLSILGKMENLSKHEREDLTKALEEMEEMRLKFSEG